MFEEALQILNKDGVFAAIEFMARQELSPDTLDTYRKLVNEAYWKRKSLADTIAFSAAAYQAAMRAEAFADAQAAFYNLASFTWDGWAEPGIEIGPAERAIGLDAARNCVALAENINGEDNRLHRAVWILGCQEMSQGQYASAKAQFKRSANLAARRGNRAEALLAQGFAALAGLIVSPSNVDYAHRMSEVKLELAAMPNGSGFVQQIETAEAVFRKHTFPLHGPLPPDAEGPFC